MMQIQKYPLPIGTIVRIDMPVGSKILSLHVQDDFPTLWVAVPVGAPLRPRKFAVMYTGTEIHDEMPDSFVGTALLHGGSFVVHVFELKP